MSRRAFLLSLALHAAFLVMVGRWFFPTLEHAGPGNPGAGVTLSTGGGGLLVEAVPASPEALASEALPSAPEIEPAVPPSLESPPLPVEMLTAEAAQAHLTIPLPPQPIVEKPAMPPKKTRAARPGSGAVHPSDSRARGSGAGAEGAGLASTGSGTGGGGGPGYVPPNFRVRYKPPYPEDARPLRLEGTVLLLVSLDARGHVIDATIQRTCGHTILDRAALKAVRSWLFDPARQNGTAIAAQVEVPVRFRFEERAGSRA